MVGFHIDLIPVKCKLATQTLQLPGFENYVVVFLLNSLLRASDRYN